MMTSSNGNFFRVTGPLCGEFTGPGEFPTQRPVMRSFDVFFDLRLNKRLSKQSWGWWFETPSWSLWRHCNVCPKSLIWTWSEFVLVMACSGQSRRPNQCLDQWLIASIRSLFQKFESIYNDLFQRNTIESVVCKIWAILFRILYFTTLLTKICMAP